jgi:hypothetical protein
MMNGRSSASSEVAERDGGGCYLSVQTEIARGFPFPWGGAMVMFSPDFSGRVDMSSYDRLTFEVRGTPGTYRAMLFAGAMAANPPTVVFEVAEDWRTVEIELASFGSEELDDVAGLALVAGPKLGSYRLGFDEVRLKR